MTKTSPPLSALLCFSLLVTRALINQPFSWESMENQISQTCDQSAHTVYDHSHPWQTTQPDALSPFQRPFFQVDQGQPVPELICPLGTLTVMSLSVCILYWAATLSMQSGTTSSHLLNKQLTITGTSECITKRAPKKLKSSQLPALIMVVRDHRTKWNDKTLQSPMA